MTHRLAPLLCPRSIAVVGASNNAGRIGGMPLELLQRFNFLGEVYPINPKYDEVFGRRCFPDIESLPEVPDLVALAIAASDVTSMLRRCHARGTSAAIVYAAGFAEAGAAGQALQDELEDFVRDSGMVVAGPNCMGFANLNINAYTAFASVFKVVPPQQQRGRVSIITQSGNVCSAVFALIRRAGVPVSHFLNTGNEACLEFAEYLEFLAHDEETDCVIAYLEQIRNGERFIDAALDMARRDKPLIVFKAGETEKGSEAVRSHTSALAGNMALYRAAFRQVNVIQADDFVQMADLAWLSGFRKRVGGTRVAIVTMSGALGAIAADKLIAAGLDVPTLSDDLQRLLRANVPDYGMVSNPIDVTGSVVNNPEVMRTILYAMATTDAVDCVILCAPGYLLDRLAETLAQVCADHDRLFVAIDTGEATCRERLGEAGVPVFSDVGRAMRSLIPYLGWLAGREAALRWSDLRAGAPQALASPPRVAGLDEHETKQLLGGFGVPVAPEHAARDEDAAVAAAERIGYPVAVKTLSADIAHKTEIGGVKLNLANAEEVRAGFRAVTLAASRHAPKARVAGVLVQPMLRGVAELIAGVTRDPVFGAALTVGLGGELTELYRDVSHRLLPVDESMALNMLHELKAFALLDGFRGKPKADVPAACRAIVALSQAALQIGPAACEIEINPLLVNVAGAGAVAIDALLLAAHAGTPAQAGEA